MKRKYHYKLYGQRIESELELTELTEDETNKEIDIIITYRKMPEDIEKEIKSGKTRFFQKDKIWFFIDEVGLFEIREGKEIAVSPAENVSLNDIKIYLLGSCMGFALYQKEVLAIHGSTVVIDGKGTIFTGERGAGKSTLTSALIKKGYMFLADDVSVVNETKERQVICPGYPQQKLCEDAVEKLGYKSQEFKRLNHENRKYLIPSKNNFFKEKHPVDYFFEIAVGKNKEVEIKEVHGIEKIKMLLKNIYRIEITHDLGLGKEYFKACMKLTKQLKFYIIKRPEGIFSVEEQIEGIEKIIKG